MAVLNLSTYRKPLSLDYVLTRLRLMRRRGVEAHRELRREGYVPVV